MQILGYFSGLFDSGWIVLTDLSWKQLHDKNATVEFKNRLTILTD